MMSARLMRSADAEEDLLDIGVYIARDNMRKAMETLDAILAAANKLAEFPGMGPARPDLGVMLHTWPVGSYVIIYRKLDDGIELVRVLHGSRDLPSVLRRYRP